MIATEYDELDRELGELGDSRMDGGAARTGLRILPLAIGVVSLFALGGIVWYAYSQGVREGSETAAPMLRPDGPAKVAPEDPGGREIPGVNLEVYDRVDGTGSDTPASVERILPRPEQPKLPPQVSPQVPAESAPVQAAPAQTVEAVPQAREAVPAPSPAPVVEDPKLAAPVVPPPTVDQETEQTAAVAVVPEKAPEIAPPPPPAASQPAATQPAASAKVATSAGDGWRIQIAALKTEDTAKAEWAKRQKANAALLGPLTLEIQQTLVKGTTYFRVRGGPLADAAAAKDLCAKLKANGVACIAVAPGK